MTTLQDELQETTTVDKLRRLMTAFTKKSFDEIGERFSVTKDINVEREFFLEQLSEALKRHFKVDSDADKLKEFETLGEIASFLDSFTLLRCVLRQKAAIAALHK